MNATGYAIFDLLLLIAMITVPFISTSILTKIYKCPSTPLKCLLNDCIIECILLILSTVVIWRWLVMNIDLLSV